MRTSIPVMATLLALAAFVPAGCSGESAATGRAPVKPAAGGATEVATLAGGCFWCTESAFDDLPGVIEAVSGYTGGSETHPTYEQVSAGSTGHFESVQVTFDPSRISYEQILDTFWRQIDPTDAGGQFADRGAQYRTAIFYHDERQRQAAEASKKSLQDSGWFDKPIATLILPAGPFYPAEEYHQNYHAKHPIEYKAYKWGSGRGPFIEKFWADKPPIRAAAGQRGAKTGTSMSSGASAGGTTYDKPDDATLRSRLTPLQYAVTQNADTEPPFRNEYWDEHGPGIYVDVVTGEPLFSSIDKFDSGTGWPSFTRPLEESNVVQTGGRSADMFGVEVRSARGHSHLGHLFADGPQPTGMRYCINSAALRFVPAARLEAEGYGRYASLFGSAAPR